MRGAGIPPDFRGGSKQDDDQIRGDDLSYKRGDRNTFDPFVDVVQVYYYQPTLTPDALHPKRVCELVLIEGIDHEVRHRYCPYQSLDNEGRLTPDSMIGYPVHVLFLRDVPDDNHVPSDSSMTRKLTDELNQYRSQILKSRDASIPYSFYDKDILPPETIERITNGDYGPLIPVEAGRLNAANPPVMAGNKPQLSRETYAGQDVIERDLERTLAIGSNQTGAPNDTRRTATEIQTMQSSVDTRLAGEQQAVVSFFCRGVRKLDALVQRFSDREQITMILGDDGSKTWMTWDKRHISGRFVGLLTPSSPTPRFTSMPPLTVSRIWPSTTSPPATRSSTVRRWRAASPPNGATTPTSSSSSRPHRARHRPTSRFGCRRRISTRASRSSRWCWRSSPSRGTRSVPMRSRMRSCSRARPPRWARSRMTSRRPPNPVFTRNRNTQALRRAQTSRSASTTTI